MGKVKVPITLHRRDSTDIFISNAVAEVTVYGEKYKFLIDSGSTLSYIDTDIVKNCLLLRSKVITRHKGILLNMMGGTTTIDKVLKCRDFKLGGGKPIVHDLHLIALGDTVALENRSYQGILGFDALLRLGTIFNFEKFTLVYSEE